MGGGCGGGPSEGSDGGGCGIWVGEGIPRFPVARTLDFVPEFTLRSFSTCLVTCNMYEATCSVRVTKRMKQTNNSAPEGLPLCPFVRLFNNHLPSSGREQEGCGHASDLSPSPHSPGNPQSRKETDCAGGYSARQNMIRASLRM